MLIAKNEKELIEIIELMEKHGLETCTCGNETLTVKAFEFNYEHTLRTAKLNVNFSRLRNPKDFFNWIHERKNDKCISIPGTDALFNFKYFLEKFYKISFEEVPGVEIDSNKK